MITPIVGAHDERVVGVNCTKGAYLNSEIDKLLLLRFASDQIEIMHNTRKECKKNVTNERVKRALFLALSKSLCECAKSVLLWCKFLVRTLFKMGVALGPHDLLENKV